MNSLNAISPIDGRYRSKVEPLAGFFSEGALIRYRVRVEIEYFIALSEVPQLPLQALFAQRPQLAEQLRDIYRHFTDDDAQEIKEIEKVTNHDVKAVEYFLKRHFDALQLEPYKEFIHFGLTSQDINNTSVPLTIKECHEQVLLPQYQAILDLIEERAKEWNDIPMLAHTHGQPASPTSLGKEMMVFAYRLRRQMEYFSQIPFGAKFGGATGNFNAHLAAYPMVDWRAFGNNFVSKHLGLERQQYTTQIENYDNMAAYFDNCKRINVILIDFCRDIWTYVSMEYFKQKIKAGEVGSSAMPHKVNPIDFENAEGNLGLANAIFEHLSHKLPISRMQRDLTDSTVSRNVGVPIAHTLISLASLQKGMGKLLLNEQAIFNDLENNWAVVAEAIQTILRSVGYPNPYEALKQLTRTNQKVTAQTISDFVDTLDVDPTVKERIRAITPHNYLGYKANFDF
ncbi:MAG: adenylosuccinate lyase [Bacteroidales bacterium]|jgi:adenylosuccinate lyase|nr:adenylosuccinate lyase [Bacteroidales bacterium]MBQ3983322.1 adenylosuccinate lyase [Bacteroidales bacterium]